MIAARAIVRERIESSPDLGYGELADLLIEEGLPEEVMSYVLRIGLMSIVRGVSRDRRRTSRPQTARENRSPRYENVRRCIDVYQQHWPQPGGGTQMLGDFTRADITWVIAYFQRLEKGAAESRGKFEQLLALMPRNDKPVHAAVARERVEAIFNA